MNILILGLKDEDGAGIVTRNIHQYFLQQGHHSAFVVKKSSLHNTDVIVMQRPVLTGPFRFYIDKIKQKFQQLYERVNPFETDIKYSFHNFHEKKVPFTAKDILKHIDIKPDVILFFWISGFVNSKTMYEFSKITTAKLFWIGTDNAPFTGGCHYPWDCKGFQNDCTNCPAIITESKKDLASKNLLQKKNYLPATLELVAGSESDYSRALSASVFKGKKIHKLIAPIDEIQFKPGDKLAAKMYFNIEPSKKVIFYGAYQLSDKRKGGKYFLDALHLLKRTIDASDTAIKLSDFLILMAGKDVMDAFSNTGIEILQTGYLNDENLVKAYQAADFFVSPSVEDSGPLMVNQSIMCGTPVVSFDTGVSMDIVQTYKTGYRAKLFDAADLALGMKYMLSLNQQMLNEMTTNCRTFGIANFSAKVYIDNLIRIFKGNTIVQQMTFGLLLVINYFATDCRTTGMNEHILFC